LIENKVMKTNAERFPELVVAFRKAIYDKIKEKFADGYVASTASLRACAFPAMKEVVESEVDPVEPMLAVNVWNAVMLTNESAFHQGLERDIKNKVVEIKLIKGSRAVAGTYCE
jgi:hypothetical protein